MSDLASEPRPRGERPPAPRSEVTQLSACLTFKVSRMSLEIATHASSLQLVSELVSIQMQEGEGAHAHPRCCIYLLSSYPCFY